MLRDLLPYDNRRLKHITVFLLNVFIRRVKKIISGSAPSESDAPSSSAPIGDAPSRHAHARDAEAVATDPDLVDAGGQSEESLRAIVYELTGFQPINTAYFDTALRHRSVLRRRADTRIVSNERLEFLGDAVLGFVVADYLYRRFRGENEGFLTRLRAKLVNGQALATAARSLGLGEYVQMSDNMVQKGGRDNASILADAMEAVMGALYLDLGMDPARDFIHRVMLDDVNLSRLAKKKDNYKSLLLEYVQSIGDEQPRYELVSEDGPGHSRNFTVDVYVGDRNLGRGSAGNKKSAEQRAAREALERLEEDSDTTHRATDPENFDQS